MLAAALTAVVGVLPPTVLAVDRTWDNGSGDGLWANPVNWSGNVAPGASDRAVFDPLVSVASATINANVSVQGVLIMAGYTGTITQNGAATLTVGAGAFSQSAGAFSGGSGAITVNNAFALSGGTFTSTTGTLTVTGAFTVSGGSFVHNLGTVAFSTSSATIDVPTSLALNNVSFVSGTKTIASGDTLNIGGTLNLVSGAVNTGTLAAAGNVDVQSGFTGNSTASLLINGSGSQTVTGFQTVGSGDLPNVEIDSGGTVNLAGTLRLSGGSWTYTGGTLLPGSSLVVFDATLTISGDHTLHDVTFRGSGTKTIASGTTLEVAGTLTLDNGSLGTGTVSATGPTISQLSTFDGGDGLLLIDGSGPQSLTSTATATSGDLPNLEIDTAGTLTLSGPIIRMSGASWTHVGGVVDPDTSLVVFAGTSSVAAGGMSFHDLTVNGGTTTLSQDLNVNGDLVVAAGTLNAAGMTITVAGDVTVDGGMSAGTANLVMNGPMPQTLGGAAASIGLDDLRVDNATGVTTTTAVSVAGTLTLNGPLDFSGQTLGIANLIAGTPANLTGDALSSLVVSGSGAGIVIPSSLPLLANLTVANPNGAALAAPITVGAQLTLSDGVLDAGAFVVVVDPAATVTRTAGHVSGALQKTIPIGAGVAVTFEIGDATTYAPVDLVFGVVSGPGTITASTTPGEHPDIGSSIINPARDVNRWWTLTDGGVSFDTLTATFSFAAGDVDPGSDPAAFVVGKRDGSWTLPVPAGQGATSITATGIASLSTFAVGEPAADLSVDISASAGSVVLGGLAHVTVVVANAGPSDATGITLTVILPAGSSAGNITSPAGPCTLLAGTLVCDLGALANGATATVSFDDAPVAGGPAAFTASVVGGQSDPVSGNDSDTVVVDVISATGSLPDAGLPLPTDGEIADLWLWLAAWLVMLLTLAAVGARRLRLPPAGR